MNYIKELNAFREFVLYNELPPSAIALWYTLMGVNNAARWKKKFNAPNAVLGQLTGLSNQGMLDARNTLIKHGLISCDKGERGRAPVYEMHSLIEAADSSLDLPLDQSADQHLNIHKHKQKQERRQDGTTYTRVIAAYETNIGRLPPMIRDEFLRWTEQVGEAVMTEAIRQTVKYGGETFGYLEKVLCEWQTAQVKTPEDIHAYRKAHGKKNIKTTSAKRKSKESVQSVFDKLRKGAEA